MIRWIIELYRGAIGLIFIVGVLVALAAMSINNLGVIVGIAVLGMVVMTVGVSALLISINDHLAAIRAGKK